ncbi:MULTISPECIES: MAPEG family protein [unclassified Duganella]|uniref:MAPEG family protein n=1 Tax=unclassified Duganella TaxID=2636909 RepID=UPI000700E01F|nr:MULTISPECIES: MAPEG family protein [unclassified Duganella]KQV54126.1 glutathione metabolism protein [Duganella sp. Root336D2]KRB95584.1 glutathione metabolism protein [Duganella sp. Root198D2]
MTVANWCIAAACVLPMMVAMTSKVASVKGKDRYDNTEPRDWASRQAGWMKRANAAQMNGFEALPLFIAAVILAQQAHANQDRVDILAMSFVLIRVTYSIIYISNLATLRTVVWFAGMGVSLAILAQS